VTGLGPGFRRDDGLCFEPLSHRAKGKAKPLSRVRERGWGEGDEASATTQKSYRTARLYERGAP